MRIPAVVFLVVLANSFASPFLLPKHPPSAQNATRTQIAAATIDGLNLIGLPPYTKPVPPVADPSPIPDTDVWYTAGCGAVLIALSARRGKRTS